MNNPRAMKLSAYLHKVAPYVALSWGVEFIGVIGGWRDNERAILGALDITFGAFWACLILWMNQDK